MNTCLKRLTAALVITTFIGTLIGTSMGTMTALAAAAPADRFADVKVTAFPVAGNVHMLMGAGGNIGVSIGEDGTLIIDDQFAELATRIEAVLTELGGDRPRVLLNTHYHGDHTGSNAHFGTTATIVAHDNVRARLVSAPEALRAALPTITFADTITVHFNGEDIAVMHLPNGHTDGDSVVWFKQSNVVHMGDHLFNGRYPYIDLDGGGTVSGMLNNLQTVLDQLPKDIHIIPGHGELATRKDLKNNITMLRKAVDHVRKSLKRGKTVDALVAEGMPASFKGWGTGFINDERFIRIVADDADRHHGAL